SRASSTTSRCSTRCDPLRPRREPSLWRSRPCVPHCTRPRDPKTRKELKTMSSQPQLHQRSAEIQEFGTVVQLPIALSYDARMYSCQRLNRVLADTQMLYALYKKHHWAMRGPQFYQLHLLLDKHAT